MVLEVAHDKMSEHDQNFPDPGMLVDDKRLSSRKVKKEQVRHILEAVAVTTGMIVIKNRETYEFDMKAPVATILDAMSVAATEVVQSVKGAASATDKKNGSGKSKTN